MNVIVPYFSKISLLISCAYCPNLIKNYKWFKRYKKESAADLKKHTTEFLDFAEKNGAFSWIAGETTLLFEKMGRVVGGSWARQQIIQGFVCKQS